MRRLTRATLMLAVLPAILAACTDRSKPDTPLSPTKIPSQVVADEETDLTVPLSGLTAAELSRFNQGRAVFERVFDSSTGLGPLFNATSCAGCHEEPSVGGIGDDLIEDVETHVSNASAAGCDDLSAHGGVVIQQHTTDLLQFYQPTFTFEPVPVQAQGIGRRSTPALFGFGLLDAVPASTILARADPTDANGDGISGRAQLVGGQPGRFGRKATDPDLLGFNAGAFMMEMGVTNQFQLVEQPYEGFLPYPYDASVDPVSGLELSNADLALATDFVRFLAPPPLLKPQGVAKDGVELFAKIGCPACHVPSLTTGSNPVSALSNITFAAFTDLLLHNMGPDLADICRGDALPEEFRTEPLRGLRFRERFLHDASALSVEEAILRHDGEGKGSRDTFNGLKATQKAALLAYLGTL